MEDMLIDIEGKKCNRRKPSTEVWGNCFYFIPLTTPNNKIIIKNINIVAVSKGLITAIKYINKLYSDGYLKKDALSRGIQISAFTYTLHNLYYPMFKANSRFTDNDGEWLYLVGDERIDVELLKYQFLNWCENRLLKKEFALLKHEVDQVDSITIIKKDIEIPLDPHQLSAKEGYYLYNVFPSYLAYQLNGKICTEVASSNGKQFSKHEFYRLQDKDYSSSMISLPFKSIKDKYYWTYSLDLQIKMVKEINHPFLRLGLRTTRLLNYIPFNDNEKFNVIISTRARDKKLEAYRLSMSEGNTEKEYRWKWKYDFSKGLRSSALETLEKIPESFARGISIDTNQSGIEVGVVCDSTTASDEDHPVKTGSSDYDEYVIFNETLKVLRELENASYLNIHYGNFLELKDLAGGGRVSSSKSKDRFNLLDDRLAIDVYYSSDAFIMYLQDAIEIAFTGKRKQDIEPVVMDAMLFLKAKEVLVNEYKTDYTICFKEGQVTITINPVKIDESRSFLKKPFELDQYMEMRDKIEGCIQKYTKVYRAAIFEIEGESNFKRSIDPKSIIRNTLAENRAVSQFIAFQHDPYIDVAYNKKANEESRKYQQNLIPYLNAFKDLMRQIGIPGKIPNSYPSKQAPVMVGLWFMNKLKSSFKYGSSEEHLPKKLIYPIIVSVVDGIVSMATFTNEIYSDYRKKGTSFEIEWLSYPEGLLRYTRVMTAYHELNESFSKEIMKKFIFNALSSFGDTYTDREIILYTNAQRARNLLEDFRSNVVTDKDIGFDTENEWLAHRDRTTIIRLVDDESGETPEYVHLSPSLTPVYGTHRGGIFKLTENTYYLINPQSETTNKATEPKEFIYNKALTEPAVLEANVYGYMPNPVWDYIMLTRELRSASSTVSTHTAIKYPLPIHMAKTAEEYITAFYDEYFIKSYLEKKALKKQRKPLD